MSWNNRWLALTIIVFIGITILSLLPPKSGVEIQSNDKINHFIAYATLAFCGLSAYKGSKTFRLLVICVAYGLFMEWMQGLVPGREQSWYDALANSLGVAIGWTIFRILSRKKQGV
jgi:VanZ family protein